MKKNNGEIKLESGVPIPAILSKWATVMKTMKVGQSFVCPKFMQVSLGGYGRRFQRKFASRSISATEVRIWRIK